MRVLIDECIDWRLSREIVGHDVKTTRQTGWTGARNGKLLALAAAAFEVFVTVDRNLAFQQPLVAFPLKVIVLRAQTNRLADLRPLVLDLLDAITTARPGMVEFVGRPD